MNHRELIRFAKAFSNSLVERGELRETNIIAQLCTALESSMKEITEAAGFVRQYQINVLSQASADRAAEWLKRNEEHNGG